MKTTARKLVSSLTILATVAFASACGTTHNASGEKDSRSTSSVEIKHQYGTTKIDKVPERIATVSWINTDTVLAFDVIPVGVPAVEWGGNANKSTDWIDAKLQDLGAGWGSEKAPKQYSETDGVNFESLAQSKPDLIVAAYSGISKEEYTKLSQIAPVIGPIEPNYTTKWQDVTLAVGKALRQDEKAKSIISDVEAQLKKAGEDNHFEGHSYIAGNLDIAANKINIFSKGDTRSRFFESLGFNESEVVKKNAPKDKFYFDWSPERSDELKSDVFYSWIPADSKPSDISAHPLFGQIPAVKNGNLVVTNNDHTTLSISASSALSLPWAIEHFVPEIAKAVANHRG
ncbi:ABC transporter substrate-binding protein [Arcanobacterium ihumii]|uniref:ABC transporter substrate-binding protein n=1 Tax=Arcanobacterium ihumii TaxID=2138162 RepID=UPI000F54A8CB|nr:ABC transporter substrate-binding protein [Arcanobacterium ihumii]